MAVSKNLKVFQYQNKKIQFNKNSFDDITKVYKKRNKIPLYSIEERIAVEVNVSTEAVRNWRFGKNGPSEIEMIMGIAKSLELSDWTILVKEYNGEKDMIEITDREKNALKRVYDSIIDFLYEFTETDGFETLMYDVEHQINSEISDAMYDTASEKLSNVYKTLKKEYFDLGKHKVYDELNEFITKYVYDMFDGKFAWKNGQMQVVKRDISAEEEYEIAIEELNCLIEKYI